MSDTLEKVQAIVVEHLGVEKDKVTDSASFIDAVSYTHLTLPTLLLE